MKLLLDTHVLVWAESLVERLGPETRALLLEPNHTLLVATARELDCHLLTANELILDYPNVRTIDARL